jgi:hypothetical protein
MRAADGDGSVDRAETRLSQTRTILQAVMWTLRRVRVAGGPRQTASAWPDLVLLRRGSLRLERRGLA